MGYNCTLLCIPVLHNDNNLTLNQQISSLLGSQKKEIEKLDVTPRVHGPHKAQ